MTAASGCPAARGTHHKLVSPKKHSVIAAVVAMNARCFFGRFFTRRAGFSLMAGLAVKAPKDTPDERFEALFPMIIAASTDDRNLVRKAVNWALRGIGKRNRTLLPKAIATAEKIAAIDSRAARWRST